MKRVGQKTLWRHNILQAYKVQKVEKLRREVDLHLIAVYYNKGERQKRHTPKNLTVHSSLHSQTQSSIENVQTPLWHQNAGCCRIFNAPTANFTRQHRMQTFNPVNLDTANLKGESCHNWTFLDKKYLVVRSALSVAGSYTPQCAGGCELGL